MKEEQGQKAAQIQILITECLSNSYRSSQKINSLRRAVELASGDLHFKTQHITDQEEELYSQLLQLQPHLL